MIIMDEERRYHRVPFECFVDFHTASCEYICELIDISINGALIAACTGATPGPDTPCQLTISLDEDKKLQIIMNGRIARKIENRVGIYCESIDEDSMIHLRKLIEYNLGDVELVNRDFEALISEHK